MLVLNKKVGKDVSRRLKSPSSWKIVSILSES